MANEINTRVLSRRGARELTQEEANAVAGSQCQKRCTLTLCSIDANGKAFDGDVSLGEC